jgi:hypothetical protein
LLTSLADQIENKRVRENNPVQKIEEIKGRSKKERSNMV